MLKSASQDKKEKFIQGKLDPMSETLYHGDLGGASVRYLEQ